MDLNNREIQKALNKMNAEKDKELELKKASKLIKLLINVEKELETINNNLAKLWEINTNKGSSDFASQIANKMNQVNKLKEKVTKTRLNLVYYLL